MEHGGALFHIGPLAVTSVMTTMLGITVLLTVLSIIGTRRMKLHPTGLQNVLEKVVEMLDNFICGIIGPELTRRFFPLLATLFLFIICCNYSGMLPLAGKLPGLSAPTASLSVTATLAIMIFFTTHFTGFKTHKLGYFKHFIQPFVFMLPLLIMEEIVRPISLSLRLYGNIMGEETVTETLFHMVPIALPVVMNVFGLLMGGIQAMVFVLLAGIYIQGVAETHH